MQSEYGDLYKVTVATDTVDKGRVVELKVKYFDTIPPCSSICVLRTGFLFAASEFGNHALYQFQVIRRVGQFMLLNQAKLQAFGLICIGVCSQFVSSS